MYITGKAWVVNPELYQGYLGLVEIIGKADRKALSAKIAAGALRVVATDVALGWPGTHILTCEDVEGQDGNSCYIVTIPVAL